MIFELRELYYSFYGQPLILVISGKKHTHIHCPNCPIPLLYSPSEVIDQLKPNRTNLYRSNLIQAILNVWCDPRTWMVTISIIHLWVLGTILSVTTCNLTYWSLVTKHSITETWSSFVQVMAFCLFGANKLTLVYLCSGLRYYIFELRELFYSFYGQPLILVILGKNILTYIALTVLFHCSIYHQRWSS